MKCQLLFWTLLAINFGVDLLPSHPSQAKPASIFQPIIEEIRTQIPSSRCGCPLLYLIFYCDRNKKSLRSLKLNLEKISNYQISRAIILNSSRQLAKSLI